MEAATERHFFHHSDDSDVLESERDTCHFCQLRSFATHKTLPITIVNEEDRAVLPSNFRFIDHCIIGAGVTPAGEEFRTGCDCPNEEDCMYASCKCLEEVEDSDDDGENDVEIDEEAQEVAEWYEREYAKRIIKDSQADPARGSSGQRKKLFAYHSRGAKAGLLRGSYVHSRAPIYECHEGCRCSRALCPNRVVERGRQVPLQIFRTNDDRGWGVKTMRELKRGQFVDRYLGEIITTAEADKRRHHASMAQRKDVYLFALDKFTDPDSMDPRLKHPLEVDGEFMSGPTRFINHSCEPNLRIFARVGDHADKHIHDLALFAIRDIAKGEELTFDYVDGQGEVESNARDEKLQGEMTRCLCESAKCRGYLW